MPRLIVCPLSHLAETVAAAGASHLATLINAGTPVERPASIDPANHLFLGFNDIVEEVEGLKAPRAEDVEKLLAFVDGWDGARPMVIHCWAGISRSTAAAYVAACRLTPAGEEEAIARRLRALAPTATPNARLVRLADEILGRDGRMSDAVAAIGRGAEAWEGKPFALDVGAEGGR